MEQGLILNADELSEFEKEIASLGVFADKQDAAASNRKQLIKRGQLTSFSINFPNLLI